MTRRESSEIQQQVFYNEIAKETFELQKETIQTGLGLKSGDKNLLQEEIHSAEESTGSS